MSLKTWLLLLAVILIGCGTFQGHLGSYQYTHHPAFVVHSPVFPVYVDANFGAADQVSIQKALEQWNFVFNGRARFEVADNHFDRQLSVLQQALKHNAFFILKIDSHNPLVPSVDNVVHHEDGGLPHGVAMGFTPQLGNHQVYLVRDRMSNEDVYYIVMHELGHALGAAHTPKVHGLMYPLYTRTDFQCIDAPTVMQVAAYQHWFFRRLNYCTEGLTSEE